MLSEAALVAVFGRITPHFCQKHGTHIIKMHQVELVHIFFRFAWGKSTWYIVLKRGKLYVVSYLLASHSAVAGTITVIFGHRNMLMAVEENSPFYENWVF